MSRNETFKTSVDESSELEIGMLIPEADGGVYQPVAPVSTIREARELAAHDLRSRRQALANGTEPLCPAGYRVWSRDERGCYVSVAEIAVG